MVSATSQIRQHISVCCGDWDEEQVEVDALVWVMGVMVIVAGGARRLVPAKWTVALLAISWLTSTSQTPS